jgi:hypothetical protein
MSITGFNRAPYFDDFNAKDASKNNQTVSDKNYLRILFQPGFAVQTRELNQLQTMLQNQINRFGLGFYRDGDSLLQQKPVFQDSISYIEFSLTSEANLTFTNEQTFLSTLVLQSNIEGRGVSGGSAKILHSETFVANTGETRLRIYVAYEQQLKFTTSDFLFFKNDTYKDRLGISNSFTSALGEIKEVGFGFSFSIEENMYFINGSFVHTAIQKLFLKKTTEDEAIDGDLAFKITENTINSFDDATLLDNAAGSLNAAAPGADRYQIILEPIFITSTQSLVNLNSTTGKIFINTATFTNDVKRLLSVGSEGVLLGVGEEENPYSAFDKKLAVRTREESGDYVLQPFKINFREFYNNGSNRGKYTSTQINDISPFDVTTVATAETHYALEIDTATAYVKGLRREFPSKVSLKGDKAREVDTEENIDFTIQYGNYVDIKFDDVDRASNSPFDRDIGLLNETDFTTNLTKKIKYASQLSGNILRTYLFDGVNYDTIFNTSDYAAADVSENKTKTTQLFKLPYDGISNISSVVYTKVKKYTVTLEIATDTIQILAGANEKLKRIESASNDEYTIITSPNGQPTILPDEDYEIKTGSTQTTVVFKRKDGSNFEADTYTILAPVEVTDVTARRRLKLKELKTDGVKSFTTVTGTTHISGSGVLTGSNELDQDILTDTFKVFKVVDSVDVEQTDAKVTVIDDGVTDEFYNTPQIKIVLGTAAATNEVYKVKYSYFNHNSSSAVDSGEYFSVNSHDQDNNITYCSIPKYKDQPLSDYLDFRVKRKIDGTYPDEEPIILRPNSNCQVSVSYYLSRVDKLIIDGRGRLTILKGVSSATPVAAITPPDALTLYEYFVPYFTCDLTQITTKFYDHKRFTMRQIGDIEKRLKNVEYKSALNTLERLALEKRIIDANNNELFKSAILVDNFSSHAIGDTASKDFLISLDKVKRELRPYYKQKNFKLLYKFPVESDVAKRTETTTTVNDYADASTDSEGNALVTYKYNDKQKVVERAETTRPNEFIAKGFTSLSTSVSPGNDQRPGYTIPTNGNTFNSSPDGTPAGLGIYSLYNPNFSAGRNNDKRNTANPNAINKSFKNNLFVQYRSAVPEGQTNPNRAFRRIAPVRFNDPSGAPLDYYRFEMYDRNQIYDGRPKYVSTKVPAGGTAEKLVSLVGWYQVNYGDDATATYIETGLGSDSLTPSLLNGLTVTYIGGARVNRMFDSDGADNAETTKNDWQRPEITTTNKQDDDGASSVEQLSTWEGTKEILFEQTRVSQTLSVQPFEITKYVGDIKLSPSSDEWIDTETRPATIMNNNGAMDAIEFLRDTGLVDFEGVLGTEWNAHETIVQGVDSTTTTSWDTNWWRQNRIDTTTTVTNFESTRTGIETTLGDDVIEEDAGERVVDVNIVPFIRSRFISFKASGLKPNTRVFAFFDDDNVSDYCAMTPAFIPYAEMQNVQIYNGQGKPDSRVSANQNLPISSSTVNNFQEPLVTTLEGGDITGIFRIPNNSEFRFRTGLRKFKLTSSPNNKDVEADTFAEASYLASGLVQARTNVIQSTRVPQLEETRLEQSENWSETTVTRDVTRTWTRRRDPIAQTFVVPSKYKNGMFLSDVDLFFAEKPDANIDVSIHLVPTRLGIPMQNIIPGSKVRMANHEVKVSGREPTDTSVITSAANATNFKFEHPVYLESNTEYAIVVFSPSPDYRVWTSELGQKDVITGNPITTNSAIGVLLKSQNQRTWTPDQTRDLVFRMRKCIFSTTPKSFEFNTKFSKTDLTTDTQGVEIFKFSNLNISDETLILPETSVLYNIQFKDVQGTIVKSFNNVRGKETKELETQIANADNVVVTATLSSADQHITPVLDLERFSLLGFTNVLNNPSLRDVLSADKKLAPGYVTKVVTLPLPADKLTIDLDIYRPTLQNGTDVQVLVSFDEKTFTTADSATERDYEQATIISANEKATNEGVDTLIPVSISESTNDYAKMVFEINKGVGNEFSQFRVKVLFFGGDAAKYCKCRNLIAIASKA